jgi:hypothetical protein
MTATATTATANYTLFQTWIDGYQSGTSSGSSSKCIYTVAQNILNITGLYDPSAGTMVLDPSTIAAINMTTYSQTFSMEFSAWGSARNTSQWNGSVTTLKALHVMYSTFNLVQKYLAPTIDSEGNFAFYLPPVANIPVTAVTNADTEALLTLAHDLAGQVVSPITLNTYSRSPAAAIVGQLVLLQLPNGGGNFTYGVVLSVSAGANPKYVIKVGPGQEIATTLSAAPGPYEFYTITTIW